MILKEPNLFNFQQLQLKKHVIKVTSPLTDSISDELCFYIMPCKSNSSYDYVITDNGYSLDSPVLYANKEILTGIITDWNPKIKINKYDEIKECTMANNLNDTLLDYLHTLVFAQGVDYLLCHLSNKSSGHYLSPVVVARKLDGLKHAVQKRHLKGKDLPGLIDSAKKGLSI